MHGVVHEFVLNLMKALQRCRFVSVMMFNMTTGGSGFCALNAARIISGPEHASCEHVHILSCSEHEPHSVRARLQVKDAQIRALIEWCVDYECNNTDREFKD